MTTKKEDDIPIEDTIREIAAQQQRFLGGLESRGEALALKMGYGQLTGLDAIHRHLIEKHHWLPREVKALTPDELAMLTEGLEEFQP
jgi:hypothetical protein